MNNPLEVGTKVIFKKNHPCSSNLFEVISLGIDIKLKCLNCKHLIIIPRTDIYKKIKEVITCENN